MQNMPENGKILSWNDSHNARRRKYIKNTVRAVRRATENV